MLHPSVDLYVNKHFKNKDELMLQMRKWALDWKFEFRSAWSNKTRVVLRCVDPNCTWRMRATKLPSSNFFGVRTYVSEHNCDTTHRNANHRQATAKVLGTLICSNYREKKYGLNPKQIEEKVRLDHGVHIGYKQAWRVKEFAQDLIRGTPEDSYQKISKWLFKVNEKNPRSKVYVEMNPKGGKKYRLLVFGQSIRGFELMRRVIAMDGTFLKGNFKGTLLGASAQGGDYSLSLLSFGIVHSENKHVWTWSFSGLKTVIHNASDLVFVSDRAPAIAKNPSGEEYSTKVWENWVVAEQSLKLASYLEESDFAKWARSYAPSNRYNIMTTNTAESLNLILNMAPKLPIMSL
ncbi:uncharacterized protein LOC112088545 [Eutrema salsugineum]|uniref:uncharacterized protein LOC112088545 n=1 Tax=Eutrema salsugineum TaxID=72664 RepID=UPI000CED5CD5|nr:uncharacterized protein LOC112088545 [Eutrema salsugineum]